MAVKSSLVIITSSMTHRKVFMSCGDLVVMDLMVEYLQKKSYF